MRRAQKFLALTPPGRGIVLHSFLLLPIVALLVRVRGMTRTAALLEHFGYGVGTADGLTPQEIARLVNAAASILGTSCLSRSLVLWHLLRSRGTSTKICLGVSKLADGNLSAHAWVELEGLPLNDGADVFARYAALPGSAIKLRVHQR